MRIADVCSHRVVCVAPETSVEDAARLMHDQDVGALVVVRAGKRKPIGIVTDRDLAVRAIAPGKNPRAVPVADVMTVSLATCRGNHELLNVMEMMRQRGIRRVPVVDAEGALIGIVTTDDLIGALAEHIRVLACSVLNEDVLERQRYRDANVAEPTRMQLPRPKSGVSGP